MSRLQAIAYEVRFEIEPAAEMAIVNRLGLQQDNSVCTSEIFLDVPGPAALTLQYVDSNVLLQDVLYDTAMFVIKGIVLSEGELREILHTHALGKEIRGTQHVYTWPQFHVSVAFEYTVAFAGRVFMSVQGRTREDVIKAKEFLWSHEFHHEITIPFSVLKPQY